MLEIAVQFLKDELNSYFLTQTNSSAVEVKLNRVVDEAGKYAIAEDAIGVSVINIEEERVLKSHLPDYRYINGQHVVLEPALKLNLYLLFAANMKQYDQALKYISYLLSYFQTRPSFNASEYPALDPRIEKLVVELQSLTYEQLNQVWAYIGGKYLPSVIYKIRMVVLQGEVAATIQPPLLGLQTEVHSK